jgi:DNA-binding CsgD family transcriptional regulator
MDQASDRDPHGVILVDASQEAEFASAPARRLLREFFPGWPSVRLPRELREWLESGEKAPFVRRRSDRQLRIERSLDALLLEEVQSEVPLTAREREVLAWVARGKTNAEIARLLWLAPSTVRKHLENVYAKLGVNTRTAAVARFLGLLDAEAS